MTHLKSLTLTLLLALALASQLHASHHQLKHVVVYQQDGRFAGWPANNGAWKFDDDSMLVGFTEAPYELQDGHNIGHPQKSWLARSTDGGESWTAYDPEHYVGDLGYPRLLRRSDGKMVALYYYSTKENPHGIFATIWDPSIH